MLKFLHEQKEFGDSHKQKPKQMKTEDDIRDVAIRIIDKLVEMGIVPDCIDSDNEAEFEVQDLIVEEISNQINQGKRKQNGNSNPRPTMVGSRNDKQQKPTNNESRV